MAAPYPLSALRTLALHVQGLTTPLDTPQDTSREGILRLIQQMGCVQIDTLQMVHRAQYVTLWSRLGSYTLSDFDHLAYQPVDTDDPNKRQLFEYWFHAACLIPFADYRYHLPQMQRFAADPWPSFKRFLADGGQEMVQPVLDRIRDEGGLRGADFDSKKKHKGSWWNWKPAKRALEYLYNTGDLMIADRVNFHRVYDLKERVIPTGVDQQSPSAKDAARFFIETGGRAFGVCQPNQPSDYYHDIKRTDARPVVEQLVKEGTFVEIEGELADGTTTTLIVHRANLSLLKQIADGAITAQRTTFLTPFDNLFWAQGRDQQLWGFNQILEAYKKPKDRVWGYFCLPILHRERLVGRFDVKLHRAESRLQLIALYLEPDIQPTDDLVAGTAAALRDFMHFHEAKELSIDRSQPPAFGERVMRALV